jgi:transcriptional regulator with XRE-family HTH domain
MLDRTTTGAMDRLVGARIRAGREALGLSRAALAARLGCDPDLVSDYEGGRVRVGAATLIRLTHVCEVDLGFFFAEAPPVRRGAAVQRSSSS